ncbi:hypothetical protein [Aneurinibacillus tyrosinisolvens]|uniref:hypothetical protein n=1 Tax=Aneurinibacillus tyrosinisolvens TaxID=1443435 RepID=UPI00069C4E3E|nr:hypothetical protein [Aneurinibacillus tyrosinisolvens]
MKWKVTGQFLAALGTLTILLTMVNFGAFFYFFGLDTSPEKEGYPYSAYPESFTLRFKDNIVFNRGIPFVLPAGQEQLKKEKAWIQILDGNGTEVYSMNKPADAPKHYTPGEIVHFHKYDGTIKNSSLFISWVNQNEARWTYVIGFPTEKIRRYTMYYSETKFFNFWEQGALVLLLVTILTVVTIGYLFGRRLTSLFLRLSAALNSLRKETTASNIQSAGYIKMYIQA